MGRNGARAAGVKPKRAAVKRPNAARIRGDSLAVFPSALGWIAITGRGKTVAQVVFGYATPRDAVAALGDFEHVAQREEIWNPRLVARLQAFAERGGDDFRDVRLDLESCTPFQREIVVACRRIPYGRTASYAEVAVAAGYPRAARAVGNVMANTRAPLIVPCHRVLAAGARLGGFSGRLGLGMKKRLLALEAGGPLPNRRAR
jgi:methylated-DNA-[protein]-cysteine S-methyltransferase